MNYVGKHLEQSVSIRSMSSGTESSRQIYRPTNKRRGAIFPINKAARAKSVEKHGKRLLSASSNQSPAKENQPIATLLLRNAACTNKSAVWPIYAFHQSKDLCNREPEQFFGERRETLVRHHLITVTQSVDAFVEVVRGDARKTDAVVFCAERTVLVAVVEHLIGLALGAHRGRHVLRSLGVAPIDFESRDSWTCSQDVSLQLKKNTEF